MFRRLIPLSLLLVATLAAQDANSPILRVATWNLENFGRRNNPPARTDAQIAAIARFIRDERQFDVLAVQEVNGAAALARLTASLGTDWEFVVGTTGGFSGDPGQIAVGFVWNDARVELLHAEELLQLPREHGGLPIFHRVPVTAAFRSRDGGLDFRAITVHLKAGRGEKNEAKRRAEVTALRGWIERLQHRDSEDRDIVVLGDFNHTYGAPAFAALTQGDAFRYLRPAELRPTIVHFPEPIDHFAFARSSGDLQDELVTGSLRVHGDRVPDITDEARKNAWRATYSDHIPVSIDLRSDPDLDPAATFTPAGADRWLRPGGAAAATSDAAAGELATVPQPPAAPSPQPAPDGPLPLGTPVRVISSSSTIGSVLGTLDAPIGEWVVVRRVDGGRTVINKRFVVAVHELTTVPPRPDGAPRPAAEVTAQRELAQSGCKAIYDAAQRYVLTHRGRQPELEDLTRRDEQGYAFLGGRMEDPWGRRYQIVPRDGSRGLRVRSLGPDGLPGTDDDILHPPHRER